MKWQGREQSSNIEDRRSQGGSSGGGFGGGMGSNPFGTGGGGFRLPSGRGGSSLGGLAIIVIFVIIALALVTYQVMRTAKRRLYPWETQA